MVNDKLGFNFGQQEQMNNRNLGPDLNRNKKNEEIQGEPKNRNSLFEDPNSERINKIKKFKK